MNGCALLFTISYFVGCASVNTSSEPPLSGNPLQTIEQRIETTTNQSYSSEDTSDLYALKGEILLWDLPPDDREARAYWLAYANLNLARLGEILGNPSQSLFLIDEAIESLDEAEVGDVESHALLAILAKEKIKFEPDESFSLVTRVRNQLSIALEIDSDNLRVHVANVMDAVVDTPGFRGRIDPDEAISLAFDRLIENTTDRGESSKFSFSPTWGGAHILGYKAMHLVNVGREEEAVSTLSEALDEYPNHFWLLEIQKQFQ